MTVGNTSAFAGYEGLGKGHETGLYLLTLPFGVGKQFLNNPSAVGMESGEKRFVKVYRQNHCFQLKKLWLLLWLFFPFKTLVHSY